MKFSILFVASVFLTLILVRAQNDQTVQPGATGASVVEAVCSRIEASCVFGDDKLLTRRLSYVESHDGSDSDTFRTTYYGGIWQVDQAMFDVTKSSTARSYLQPYINSIKTAFGIDWLQVSWQDLTKPLYSALGARLYLQYNSRSNQYGIPRSIEEQGDYWVRYYRPQASRNEYVTEANRLEQGCKSSNGADIVYVLDESGSVGSANFAKIKSFVVDSVKSYDVGPGEHQYRIGLIKYSSTATREFDLKTYQTQSEVIAAVEKMTYRGGGTYTNLALDEMVTKSFTAFNGARPLEEGHPRIGIVVTDGQSAEPQKTAVSAGKAHDADITVFSVGVGSGINLQELDTIASAPVCLHVMLLDGFTEFESLKYAIEQRTCDAPIIISPGKNSTTGGHLPPGGDQNCKIKVPVEGITIELTTSKGKTILFTSKSTYPSTDYFEEKTEATTGHIGVMFIPQPLGSGTEAYVFCNIKGDNNTESNITVGSNPGDHDGCKDNPCTDNGVCVNKPGGGYECECKTGYTGKNCLETVVDTTPSTTTTTTPTTTTTTTTTLPTTTNVQLPSTSTYNCETANPCTEDNIRAQGFYFAHDDPTKFIQCDTSGRCFVKDCPQGLDWSQEIHTCA